MMLIMSTAIVKRLKQIGDDAVVSVVDIVVVVHIAIVIHVSRVVGVVVVRRPQPPHPALFPSKKTRLLKNSSLY
ncbi:MAG: hypothetical protein WC925_05440 [Bacilli bacterium]|jgi:hypothetical protein